MRQAVENALQDFAGAVVLISHDRHMVESCCDQLWRLADGSCEPYDGDLDDYAKWLREERKAALKGDVVKKPAPVAAAAPIVAPSPAPVGAAAPKRLDPNEAKLLREAVKKLDKQMERLNKELAGLDAQLADPALYEAARHHDAAKLQQRQSAARQELATLEEDWLAKSEALQA